MEYLNDEMDELFRKAGEQYPLKTSDSDWDAVLGRLQPAKGNEAPFLMPDGKKKNNRRRFLWLLLLLPLGLFSLNYFQASKENARPTAVASSGLPAASASKDKLSHSPEPTISAAEGNKKSGATHRENSTAGNKKDPQSEKIQSSASHAVAAPGKFSAANRQNKPVALADASRQASRRHKIKSPAVLQQDGHRPVNGYAAGAAPAQDFSSAETKPATPDATQAAAGTAENAAATEAASGKMTGAADAGHAAGTNGATPGKGDSLQPDPAKAGIVTEAIKKDSVSAAKKKSKAESSKEKGIYLSLLAGPDFSTVKLQSIKKMGYSVGLLAGYRFNKHVSLEAGIFWDKKQYYSKGEYFNKSKTNIPASYDIRDLDGSCNMFEIPIAVRYDFSYNRKGRFFSTAGFSSYLMKKENYSYTAEYGGSAWTHTASYKNSGNNFLSILQLSGGYEYNWGRIGRIRIEPYLKIPLTGVGIGQLAISSAGLHLGITHSFR